MTTRLDGCAEYEQELIEASLMPDVDSTAPPRSNQLNQHLRACPSCRRALDAYRTTHSALQDVFADRRPESIAPPRRRALRLVYVMASVAAVAVVLLGALGTMSRPAVAAMDVHPEIGAVVAVLGPRHARIEEGTSTFEIGASPGTVDTPAGRLRCAECSFTVEVLCASNNERDTWLPPGLHGLVVLVTVAEGRVGSTGPDRFRMVLPGDTYTMPN